MAKKITKVIATALGLLGGLWLFFKKKWRPSLDIPVPETPPTELLIDKAMEYDFYVENGTKLIYEVKVFDGFALARPANPWFYTAIRKIDLKEFEGTFEQYCGDPDLMRKVVLEMGETLTVN